MGSEHILSKLEIQLKYPSDGIGHDGGAKADTLTDEVFVPILERVIDEYPDNLDQYIDSLTVDVPPVTEDELPAAFEESLREALSNALEGSFLHPDIGLDIPVSAGPGAYDIQLLKSILDGIEVPFVDSGIQHPADAAVSNEAIQEAEEALADEPVSDASETVAQASLSAVPDDTRTGDAYMPDSDSEPVYAAVTASVLPLVRTLLTNGVPESLIGEELSLIESVHLLLVLERGSMAAGLPDNTLYQTLREKIATSDNNVLDVIDRRIALWKSYISGREKEQDQAALQDSIIPEEGMQGGTVQEETVSGDIPLESVSEQLTSYEPVSSQPEQEQAFSQEDDVHSNDSISQESISESEDLEDDTWEELGIEQTVPDSRYYIQDAGLTLLHPFIVPFLQRLGLVKKGGFVSPEARVEAVHLLREMVYPGAQHFNHNLLLEKVLCGLPPEYSIPEEWEPTDEMKEESEALLKAVCGHWKPLSKSSTNALRSSFLQRNGSVEMDQGTWIVRVESSAIDILLDELPWELSFIILPWTERPILVEWQQESF